MSLNLTPEILRAAYDFLCTTQPFSRWNMPDGEDVRFYVIRNRHVHGWYQKSPHAHEIAISSATVGHTAVLMTTMAHEMIHLHEKHNSVQGHGEHSAAFKKYAERVSKIHGFDPKAF